MHRPTSTGPSWTRPGPHPRGSGVLATLLVALGIPLGLLTHPVSPANHRTGDSPAEEPALPATPRVRVALHLEESVPKDGCVVWTAAFQAAWDRLADLMNLPKGLPLGPPARPEDVRALNAGRLAPGVVAAEDLTVVAGPSTRATWAAVGEASDLAPPADATTLPSDHFVAFARLRASIRYALPFEVHDRPLLFGARATPVRAYGLPSDLSGEKADRRREQVDLHLPEGTPHEDACTSAVVVLHGLDGRRVVLSGRPPAATLSATWRDAAAVVATVPARRFGVVDRLSIPRVSIQTGRSYDSIAPAPFVGSDARLLLARQDVSLTVDERGADVDAEALLVAYGAIPVVVELDGPFLVALLAPDGDAPYVIAWLGSEDGLTRWDARVGRTIDPQTAAALAGRWVLDGPASLEATAAAWRRAAAGQPRQLRQVERSIRDLEEYFRARRFDTVIADDGEAIVTTRARTERPRRVDSYLARDGARLLLVIPPPPSEPAQEEAAEDVAEERWIATQDRGRLLLRGGPAAETLVLRR